MVLQYIQFLTYGISRLSLIYMVESPILVKLIDLLVVISIVLRRFGVIGLLIKD